MSKYTNIFNIQRGILTSSVHDKFKPKTLKLQSGLVGRFFYVGSYKSSIGNVRYHEFFGKDERTGEYHVCLMHPGEMTTDGDTVAMIDLGLSRMFCAKETEPLCEMISDAGFCMHEELNPTQSEPDSQNKTTEEAN